jgi:hypothetical protein
VKRLVSAYRRYGPASVRSKKRGQPSNRRYADTLREQVLALEAERYQGFGPTLLAEYLAHEHAIVLSVETLRQWLIQAGRWKVPVARVAELTRTGMDFSRVNGDSDTSGMRYMPVTLRLFGKKTRELRPHR